MKKIISLIVISVMLLSALVMNVGAADEAFTKEAAEALLIEGYQRMMLVYYGHIDEYSGEDAYKYLKADTIKGEGLFKKHSISYTASAEGEKYYAEVADGHILVTDERFDTMEKSYAYTGAVFEETLAKKIIDENPHAEYWKKFGGAPVESLRPSDGGMIWYEGSDKWVEYEKGKVVAYAFASTHTQSGILEEILKSVGDLTVNGNTATIKVGVELREVHPANAKVPDGAREIPAFLDPRYVAYMVPYEKEVTFVKTADGWRISGGSFFDILMLEEKEITVAMKVANGTLTAEEAYGVVNPNTGDETAILVALLALSGIAVVCVPAMKKRRIR